MTGEAQVLTASNLIEYQTGAVVSRIILKKRTGNITLFAFDAGEGLSEHTTPFDALVLIVEGAAQISISGRTMTAGAGDLVIMPAGEPHSIQAEERFKMALVMIRE